MLKFRKIGIINSVGAAAANLKDDTTDDVVCLDNTTNPLVAVLPRIPNGAVANISYQASQAEVRRVHSLGHLADEVIVASQRYRVVIDHLDGMFESARRGTDRRYASVAPAVLTGTAATDRLNIFTDLVAKINTDYLNYGTAYLIDQITVTAAAGDLNEVIVGSKVFQTDSNEAAADFVGYVAFKNTTWTGAETLHLYNTSGTLDATTDKALQVGNYVTGDGTTLEDISTDAANSAVLGQGLVFEDNAGYYTTPNELRPGKSILYEQGFSLATVAITLEGAYSIGIGTDMLALKPIFNLRKNDVISGNVDYNFNVDPVAGQTYELAVITINASEAEALSTNNVSRQFQYHLYMDESNSTNVTNLKNALNAL